jgi:D-arabinose 1-dehydrogenase-like Zn-dependent alcohol dehydrogenase
MKAAVVRASGEPLVIEERPDPEPNPRFVPGHEGVGPVEKLGGGGRTRVIYETRPLASVNESIEDVLRGHIKARIVFDLGAGR